MNAEVAHVWLMPLPLRRVLLLAPPLLFAGLAVAHPMPEPNLESLMDAATWFAVFHVIQLVLTGSSPSRYCCWQTASAGRPHG